MYLELFEDKKEKEEKEKKEKKTKEGNGEKLIYRRNADGRRIQQSQERMTKKNKYRKDKYGHIEEEIEFKDKNPFNALTDEDEGNMIQ